MNTAPSHNKVREAIANDLKWFPFQILTKITFIHFVTALLTLSICPQFGLTPFAGSFGLMDVFMRYGPIACATLCGAIFLGTSGLALSLVLKPGDLLYLNRHRYPIYMGLSLASLLILFVLSKTLIEYNHSVTFNAVWFLSGFTFALLFHGIGQKVRT